MFCGKCGAALSAAYCGKCGAPNSKIQASAAAPDSMKFCPACGSMITAAYCPGCGHAKALKLQFGGAAMRLPSPGRKASDTGGNFEPQAMKFPLELCLKCLMLCSALAIMLSFSNFFTTLVFIFAIIPAVLSEFNAAVYNKNKLVISLGCAGLGLLFAILSLVRFSDMYRRLPSSLVFMFILWLAGLLVIALIGARKHLNLTLPEPLERLLVFTEGSRYIFAAAGYMSFATHLCLPAGSIRISLISLFLSLCFALYLVSFFYVPHFNSPRDSEKLKIWLWILLVLSVLRFFAHIIFFSGTSSILHILLYLACLAITVYIFLMYKALLINLPAEKAAAAEIVFTEPAAAETTAQASAPETTAQASAAPVPADAFAVNNPNAPSRFHGGIGGLIGIMLLFFFLAIITIIIAAAATSAAFREEAALGFIVLIIFIIIFVCVVSLPGFLLVRWEVRNSEVGGYRLGFAAGFGSYLLLNIKIILLTIITLGWYSILGGAQAAAIRWKIKNTQGGTSAPSQFNGHWYSLFGINFGCGLLSIIVPVIIWYVTISSISGRGGSSLDRAVGGLFSNPFSVLQNPFDYAGNIVGDFLNYAAAAFIIAFILTVAAMFIIGALRQYYTIRFEINNSFVSSRQWTFSGSLGGLMGIILVSMLLSIITIGIYNLLGFPHLFVTKYKIENINQL